MTSHHSTLLKKSKQNILRLYALILFFCAVLAGFFINIAVGKHFFFDPRIPYESISFWTFFSLIPCSAVLLFKKQFDEQHSNHYPAWWVRRLLMIPLFVLFCAALVATAPLGWIITYTWIEARPNKQISARIISIEEYRQKVKSCDQYGEIAIEARQIKVCFEGLIDLPVKGTGEIKLIGKQSSFGFMVERIQQSQTK